MRKSVSKPQTIKKFVKHLSNKGLVFNIQLFLLLHSTIKDKNLKMGKFIFNKLFPGELFQLIFFLHEYFSGKIK